MKVNKFSLTYLAGMVMILISGCFPYLGYQFTMKDYQDVKEWFPLLNLKKLADRYQAMGDINLFVRILPYLAILTGIAGIVLVVIYLRGDRDTWDIFNLMFFIPAVLSGIELFLLTHSKTIRAIHGIMEETTRSKMAIKALQDTGWASICFWQVSLSVWSVRCVSLHWIVNKIEQGCEKWQMRRSC